MKRDFTQQFIKAEATKVYILAEHEASGKFLVFRSFDDDRNDDYYSEDFYYLPSLDLFVQDNLTLRLAEYLYAQKLALNSYREIASETDVRFSFLDNTPGEESNILCVHAIADQSGQSDQKDNPQALYMHLSDLIKLGDVAFSARVVKYGLAKLCMERGLPIVLPNNQL